MRARLHRLKRLQTYRDVLLDKNPILRHAPVSHAYSVASQSGRQGGRFAMSMMTPEQEAANALDWGIGRSGLSKAAQRVYDRLLQERQELAQAEQEEQSEQEAEIQQS